MSGWTIASIVCCCCLFITIIADDPDRRLSRCEVCKFLATELEDNMKDHNSTSQLRRSYKIDDKDHNKIDYKKSELRLMEVMETVCKRILKYNVHAERKGSNRYSRGMSQTMQALTKLKNRNVTVKLDIPDDMWDHPSAEITDMKHMCDMMLGEFEDNIRDWYFNHQEVPLKKFLCEDLVLDGNDDNACLYEVFVPGKDDKKDDDDEDEEDEKETAKINPNDEKNVLKEEL